MHKNTFIESLKDRSLTKLTNSLDELESIVKEYPYFQSGRILLAKEKYIRKTKDAQLFIAQAAVHTTDRRHLKAFIETEIQHAPEEIKAETLSSITHSCESTATIQSSNQDPVSSELVLDTDEFVEKTHLQVSDDSEQNNPSIEHSVEEDLDEPENEDIVSAEFIMNEPGISTETEGLPHGSISLDQSIQLDDQLVEEPPIELADDVDKHVEALHNELSMNNIANETTSQNLSLEEATNASIEVIDVPQEINDASNKIEDSTEDNIADELTSQSLPLEEATNASTEITDVPQAINDASNKIEDITGETKAKDVYVIFLEIKKDRENLNKTKNKFDALIEELEKNKVKAENQRASEKNNLPEKNPPTTSGINSDIGQKEEQLIPSDELKTTVTASEITRKNNLKRQQEIIEAFIENNPKIIRRQSRAHIKGKSEDLSAKSTEFKAEVGSEYLAEIYIEQNKIKKAIAIYESLSLKFPEKKSYFAELIKKIKSK